MVFTSSHWVTVFSLVITDNCAPVIVILVYFVQEILYLNLKKYRFVKKLKLTNNGDVNVNYNNLNIVVNI